MVLHQPVKKYVFNVRATYQREAEKAVMHLGSLGIKRIALVHTDDSFGVDGATGAQKGLAAVNLVAVVTEKFDRSKPDFSKIVPKIVAADTQAVIMIASGSAVVSGLTALRAAGSGAQLVTLSNNASGGFVKSLGERGPGVVVTQVFPNERAINYGFIKEAQDLLKDSKDATILSPAMLEGYAAAKVLVEALKRSGPSPTRGKIQSSLENMKRFDIGGLEINFSTTDHTGLDFADLSIISTEGKFKR
jgi:ABC-type branched-subunit amino acid transport system substrate-binding protein